MFAIVDMQTPGTITPLNRERYDKLYQAIDSFVFAEVEKNPNKSIPTFDENKFTRGVMKLRCSTPGAKSWLSCAIRYVPSLWTGMNLLVVDFDKIPVPIKVLGLFNKCNYTGEQICRMLSLMNRSVDTARWNVIRIKTSDKGTHVVFDIDEEQHAVLIGCKYNLYFGAGIAKFKVLTNKQSSANAQKGENEIDLSLSDLDLDETDDDDENDITIITKPNNNSATDNANNEKSHTAPMPNTPKSARSGENQSGASKAGNDTAPDGDVKP